VFAPWAPAEGAPAAAEYARGLLQQYRLKTAAGAPLATISWRPPVLHTERLVLRGYEPADAENIFSYASDPETARYMFWDRAQTIHDVHAFLNGLVAHSYRTGQLDYAICLKDSPERAIGGMAVYVRSPENGRYELGYVLARPYWNQGLVPEAGRRLLDVIFANPAVERVEAPIFADNARSRRAAEKMGLHLDGVIRSARFLRGRRWDEAIYSRIRSDH
jgi:[ribosomal protein S5]-alanine N-acetyltransferase